MKEAVIRRCTENDVDDVYRLGVDWAAEEITWGQVPPSRETIAAKVGPYFQVAAYQGRLVGFICGSLHTSEGLAVMRTGERYLEVDELYVRPESRRKGIGGKLLNGLIETARNSGVTGSRSTRQPRTLIGL